MCFSCDWSMKLRRGQRLGDSSLHRECWGYGMGYLAILLNHWDPFRSDKDLRSINYWELDEHWWAACPPLVCKRSCVLNKWHRVVQFFPSQTLWLGLNPDLRLSEAASWFTVIHCVVLQGSTEEEKQLSKSTSMIESQHHHLLYCLEKTTVSNWARSLTACWRHTGQGAMPVDCITLLCYNTTTCVFKLVWFQLLWMQYNVCTPNDF